MKGRFFVFEGIDGSGKKTACLYTQKLLEERGIPVEVYQYPDYGSPWGIIIEDFLSGFRELDVATQFLTYAADIIKDQRRIRENLDRGLYVLADRYITSTVAFQCARGFDIEKALHFVCIFEVIPADVIFFMNVSPEIGKERKERQKGNLDRHEVDVQFLEKVNNLYKTLRDKNFLARTWRDINANEELSKVEGEIESEIEDIITNDPF